MGNFWSTEGAGPLDGIVGSPPFKGVDQDFETFKKGGGPEKRFWGWGNQMREKSFKDKEGATQLFKLNLGIVKNKLRTFRDKLA